MKKTVAMLCILILCIGISAQNPLSKEDQLEWWKDARFGMFIHWGPVSLKGTEIG